MNGGNVKYEINKTCYEAFQAIVCNEKPFKYKYHNMSVYIYQTYAIKNNRDVCRKKYHSRF